MYKLGFDIPQFLQVHWQNSPVLLKKAMPDFIDPVSAEELAGLAMEEVPSRIVVTGECGWSVQDGPFTSFDEFGESNWQLLVQAVNHWLPQTNELASAFRFLPDWRFDDLMVSYATPSGGVGPHIDNYDTFILQGQGSRRWLVGDRGEHRPRNGDASSSLVDDFQPIIDAVLEAGDVLYIPPGYPHCGSALTPALSYSFGFRAPSQQELFGGIADGMIDGDFGRDRFVATSQSPGSGLVSKQDQKGLLEMVAALAADSESATALLGMMLSQSRFEFDLCPPEQLWTEAALLEYLSAETDLVRVGGLKVLIMEGDSVSRVFVDGEAYPISGATSDQLSVLANATVLGQEHWVRLDGSPACVSFFVQMLNLGLYYVPDEQD